MLWSALLPRPRKESFMEWEKGKTMQSCIKENSLYYPWRNPSILGYYGWIFCDLNYYCKVPRQELTHETSIPLQLLGTDLVKLPHLGHLCLVLGEGQLQGNTHWVLQPGVLLSPVPACSQQSWLSSLHKWQFPHCRLVRTISHVIGI